MDGIEYYPRQRKNSSNFKLWVLTAILTAIIVAVYYYYLFVDKQQTPATPKTSFIIVKEPATNQTKTQFISIPFNAKAITQTKTQISEVLENLDEIKSTVQ